MDRTSFDLYNLIINTICLLYLIPYDSNMDERKQDSSYFWHINPILP